MWAEGRETLREREEEERGTWSGGRGGGMEGEGEGEGEEDGPHSQAASSDLPNAAKGRWEL
eukprot:2759051-Rhodomonas_salina.1